MRLHDVRWLARTASVVAGVMLIATLLGGCGQDQERVTDTANAAPLGDVPADIPSDVLKRAESATQVQVDIDSPAGLNSAESAAAVKALGKQVGGDKLAGIAHATASLADGRSVDGIVAYLPDAEVPPKFGPSDTTEDEDPSDKLVVYDSEFSVVAIYYF